MPSARRHVGAVLAVAATAASLLLAGCTTKQADATGVPTPRGGTLHVLMDTRVQAWDPQRIGTVGDAAFAVRTFTRTLTAQAPGASGFLSGLEGDLATTTGHSEDNGRTWSFSLVSDAPWQDGRFVTCADVKYGVSRSFARDRITGGSQEAVDLLDIPSTKDAQGRTVSAYQGPYSGVGQDLYDKAVVCVGQEITFHLNAPRYDFDQIVSLPAFSPARKDQDTDRFGPLSIFSSGPYMLEGVWKPGVGGRFVRNRKWIPRDDPIRFAWPDVIEVEEGIPTTELAQRLVDDRGQDGDDRNDKDAIAWADAPAAMLGQLQAPSIATRVTKPDSGIVDMLLPTTTSGAASVGGSPVMANPAVRKAFGLATDRSAYVTAAGSPMVSTTSTLAANLPGRRSGSPVGITNDGDPSAAKAVLTGAGVSLPVSLRLGYAASDASTRALTALLPKWRDAGFSVTLVPDSGSGPVDVRLTGRYAAWPTPDAVLPALAARIGDPALDAAVEAARRIPDRDASNRAWGDLDATLVTSGDAVPLAERQRVHVRGSGIEAYSENVLLGGYPDLGTISVQ